MREQHTDIQTDIQTDRQTYIHTYMCVHTYTWAQPWAPDTRPRTPDPPGKSPPATSEPENVEWLCWGVFEERFFCAWLGSEACMRRSLPPLPEINWPQTAHNEIPLWRRACGAYHAFWAWLDLRPKTTDRVLQTSPKKTLAADSIMPARWTAPTFCMSCCCLRKHTLRSHISNIEQIPDNLKATYCNYKSKILYTEMLLCT